MNDLPEKHALDVVNAAWPKIAISACISGKQVWIDRIEKSTNLSPSVKRLMLERLNKAIIS